MRILHLADGDPRQPGIGGSATRTREINCRLAERHEITALVPGYPGAQVRIEDGIRWIPIGPRTGGRRARLAYLALVGREVVRRPHDLVVEDFSAPFSVGVAPLFTRRPVVGMVHWLFASQLRKKYGLPFDWIERGGLQAYDQLIAVSEWLADELRRRRPHASITTIPNAIGPDAFSTSLAPPEHLLFVGRLDTFHKGIDLLFAALGRVHGILGERTPLLLLAGDGPDRVALETLALRLGIAPFVRFLGRVEGRAKYDLMARAHAVVLPSRFETFGMVAAESMGAATPCIAFAIGPLHEVAREGGVRLVPPFDVGAFSDAIVDVINNPSARAQLGAAGRSSARRYADWDVVTARQEEAYLRALTEGPIDPLRRLSRRRL